MRQELTSGFGIKGLCWVELKGSVPPKSGKVCMSVCCSCSGNSSLPPYSQEKVVGAGMVRCDVITKMPKGNFYLPPGSSGTHRGKERLPLEPGLLLGGRLGTQTGESRSWWSFYSPTQGKLFLFLVLNLYASTALWLCLQTDCIARARNAECEQGAKLPLPPHFHTVEMLFSS